MGKRTKTIQDLKKKLNRTKPGCCFSAMDLMLLSSFLPKQEYGKGEKIMICCALPIRLVKLVKNLVESKRIPNSSFLWRLALRNYFQTGWIPPLPRIIGQRVDYSFRVNRETWNQWQNIHGNKTKILESWGWFLGIMWTSKLT